MTLAPGLYVVATPIGNLADCSDRARQVLSEVDLIAAEDTRHSRTLLAAFSITTSLTALHEHNERTRTPQLLADLQAGKTLALISDAGTPLVSDPGFRLVRGARLQDSPVYAVPGPCSAVAALSIAGLPSDRFAFEGFLPAKSSARLARLKSLAGSRYTLLFFVPARQLDAVLADMIEAFGDQREALIAREISKRFEESRFGVLRELLERQHAEAARGEIVVAVRGIDTSQAEDDPTVLPEAAERLLVRLLKELPLKRAVAVTADFCEINKNRLYQRALLIKNQS